MAALQVSDAVAEPAKQLIDLAKTELDLIDSSKVTVRDLAKKGAAAFARVAIKKGDVVEVGIVRRLPRDFDGMKDQFVFTWSDEVPNKTWAMASGCATFYNTAPAGEANTHMERIFDEDRFVIRATKDIEAGEVRDCCYRIV